MSETLTLRLEGFEGPLDLLLELARAQKVDIARISILALVDQYLEVIEREEVRLELAADWLVMAAWLAWLKSRLLLPPEEVVGEEEDAEAQVARLTERLAALEAMRRAALWLGRRPWLGHDVFARGAPEQFSTFDRSGVVADLPALLQAYVGARRRAMARRPYRPKHRSLWTVQEAIARLQAMVGKLPSWQVLSRFLPEGGDPVERRAAVAATLIAGLEMARGGLVELRQEAAWGPIEVRGLGAASTDVQAARDG